MTSNMFLLRSSKMLVVVVVCIPIKLNNVHVLNGTAVISATPAFSI